MQILIEYESSWRNSFLDGSNNEPLPKKGRNFVGSMTSLKVAKNFIQRDITPDTVMGILNRLIGDQRKLYQARSQPNYYFSDIEPVIGFVDKAVTNNEVVYIRNMTGSTDQNSFTGAIKIDDAMFSADYAGEFWGVLALDFAQLCQFIVHDITVPPFTGADPLTVIARLELLNEEKAVENVDEVLLAKDELNKHFPDAEYLDAKGEIKPIMFYCSGLYLQLKRLENRDVMRFNMSTAKTKLGGLSGISKRGFTKKDFMDRFTTGGKKTIWGNPYIRKERIKGEGEVVSMLTKASGQLEINLDIAIEKARELRGMIENAGVSSFYFGKKGLAFVKDIRI
jgi:hypothetical protein